MDNLDSIQERLRELQKRPNHDLGQNFLINDQIVEQIVTAGFAPFTPATLALTGKEAVDARQRVLEIGPGLGVLTGAILDKLPKGGQLLAIEKDHGLAANLDRYLHHPRQLKIIESDATTFDRSYHFKDGQYLVMANLPFNISSFIVNALLTQAPRPARLILMLQQEVADRLLAPAGHSSRGLLSVITEFYTAGHLVCPVPRANFYPVPKVDAAVICLDVDQPIAASDQALFKLVKGGFAQRRKNLKNALAASLGLSKEEIGLLLVKANLEPTARAQELTLKQWQKLAKVLKIG
ncbi:MAG: 16S rRNA (adenine(1518)-N(6)/adenine(1519)-N(6))-dimethyltransferase RsmA [bacterium]|nr:16S rRNA (adenine(1518)-N(6)/adenine(1519)-N(6))-dimethyltransferase RsmA [bacterium]